ncbi:MAG: FAD-dependent oxidoreductase, partial [Pseudomonadota bacterium]
MSTHILSNQLDSAVPADVGHDARPHAVIIGAGFGGLAAAIRLGARGYRVTVVERLEQPGGRASVFRQDGFTFDAGPTIITAPFVLEELWTLCGKTMADHVPIKAMDPFYTIRFDDGSEFRCNGDPEFMRAEIARFEPKDVKGYEKFFAESKANYGVGFDLMDKPFHKLLNMAAYLPQMARLRADRSVYGHVAKHISNP